jgi:hypothetical protein
MFRKERRKKRIGEQHNVFVKNKTKQIKRNKKPHREQKK